MTDTIFVSEGMQMLINRFGIVDAGRFVYLLNKEPLATQSILRSILRFTPSELEKMLKLAVLGKI